MGSRQPEMIDFQVAYAFEKKPRRLHNLSPRRPFTLKLGIVAAISLTIFSFPSIAAVVYNEAVNNDLSNSGLAPTKLIFATGSNQVLGTTGRDTTGVIDRDYLTFTVPLGFEMTSLSVLPGTTAGGKASFIGLQSGSQVTLPSNTMTATGLLGYFLYAPDSRNILPNMAISANGSSGFSPEGLGAGAY